jgi:hypothetical protein
VTATKDHDLWEAVRKQGESLSTQGRAIISLEANQQAISDNVKQMAEDQRTYAKSMTVTLETLNDKIGKASATRWDTIWQAAAVALTVGGFFWFIITDDIDHAINLVNNHSDDGHPSRVIERIEANKGYINDLRIKLQDQVPRSEHELRWSLEERAIDRIHKRLDGLEARERY